MTEKATVALVSLGCPKNLVDSEVMLGLLEQAGYPIVEDTEQAQVVIVNTCAFIQPAEEEALEALLDVAELKETGQLKALICAGCFPQRHLDNIIDELPEVDVFLTPGAVDQIVTAVDLALSGKRQVIAPPLTYLYDAQTPRWRSSPPWSAYLKIAEGCDNRCTFCTVPSLRGPYRSRPVDDICQEFSSLVEEGVREVCLIGQDTTNYGSDRQPPASLIQLLDTLPTHDYDGWVRLMYMYPDRVTEPLIEAMAQNLAIVPYFDIPLQHVAPAVLRRMRRPGNAEVYLELISQIRQIIPEAAFRTTFIVGFPGETETDFDLLLDFAAEARFDRLAVFRYWPEEGTSAARLPDRVPVEVAEERQAELYRVQEDISLANNERLVGQRLQVLVERKIEEGDGWVGRSYRDAPEIDGEVLIHAMDNNTSEIELGTFVWATVEKALVHDLQGVI